VIAVRDVRKSYGATKAVDGLSLDVSAGEVFGLLGPNGAGKTTTIHVVVGLVAPDSGTVVVDGRGAPTDPEVRRRIGVAPQAIALYDELTGEENLTFFGRLFGLSGGALRGRVDRLLEWTGLAARRRDRVKGYSGGMKRRLNLAAALVHDPPILLLDEPTAGVDPQSRNAIFDAVRELRGEGRTVVYTTHYMEEAERLCDRVAILDHGRLLALGTVDALVARHGGRSVVTVAREGGEERRETADPVGELTSLLAASGRGGAPTSVRIDRPNLESVFLSLTGRSLRD
jgi:ABC-2 type transport system ATP-binding protein